MHGSKFSEGNVLTYVFLKLECMTLLTQHISLLGIYSKEIFRNCIMDSNYNTVPNIKNQK